MKEADEMRKAMVETLTESIKRAELELEDVLKRLDSAEEGSVAKGDLEDNSGELYALIANFKSALKRVQS